MPRRLVIVSDQLTNTRALTALVRRLAADEASEPWNVENEFKERGKFRPALMGDVVRRLCHRGLPRPPDVIILARDAECTEVGVLRRERTTTEECGGRIRALLPTTACLPVTFNPMTEGAFLLFPAAWPMLDLGDNENIRRLAREKAADRLVNSDRLKDAWPIERRKPELDARAAAWIAHGALDAASPCWERFIGDLRGALRGS